MTTPTKIVVIDDDITSDQPIMEFLRINFGSDNVYLFQVPDEGVQFIRSNLSCQIVVILDIMFNGVQLGLDVFQRIVQESALVTFIIMTGSREQIPRDSLEILINGHAWSIIQRDRPAMDIIYLVKSVMDSLSVRIDGAIQSWVASRPPDHINQPFVVYGGHTYSLGQILESLRVGSHDRIGFKIGREMIRLAVELLYRDKTRIGND